MELNEIKEYLRVDGDEDDKLISSLFITTKLYIKNATGVTEEIAEKRDILELYNLTVKILLSHWYENRLPEMTGPKTHELSFSLTSLFLQLEAEYLKYKKDDKK